MNFKNNLLRQHQIKRAQEKRIIKKTWADSGSADDAIDRLKTKYRAGRPDPEDLPF